LTSAANAPNCDPGYYCRGGSSTTRPNDETGNLCKAGFYCPGYEA
jgi:hypothetical protein